MTKNELKNLRERLGWTQESLANTLSEALDRRYSANTISRWETGARSVPAHVGAFMEALAIDQAFSRDAGEPPLRDTDADAPGDSVPADPLMGAGSGFVPLSPSGVYIKACTELWQIVATGVGMTGAAIGSQALMLDGRVIDADKEQLGEAWGKLAETNATFRNMLVGLTTGGAWLQVAVVTGSTVGRCWANHAIPLPEASYGAAANGHVPDGAETNPDQAAA